MHKAIMWREVTVGLVVLAACCEHDGVGDWGRTFRHSQECGNEKKGGGG
jgi:hypothetical protein